ncbi:MAG: helix-turn-helix transcriptional regulator [Spirochaetes bacterium]|nr:helix-turn-helix transcriptional regulator [Spirochaetota bacterium]
MGFFDDLQWIAAGKDARCRAWVSRVFPNYWGLQYAHRGKLAMERPQKSPDRAGQLRHFAAGRADARPLVPLKPPVLWVTGPGAPWRYGVPPASLADPSHDFTHQTSWEHRYVTFRGPRVQRWLDSGFLPPPVPGQLQWVDQPEQLAVQFDALIEAVHRGEQGLAVHLLEGILLGLSGAPGAPEHAPMDPFQAIPAQIDLDPSTPAPFPDWARELGMSYSHFRARFKILTGMPPHQYLLKARLDQAARFLRAEDGSLAGLALRCGFDDPIHFNKMFRRRYGMPPGRFREEARAMSGGKS